VKPYLCIDPGASGGWVLQYGEGLIIMGDNDGLVDLCPPVNTTVVIEKVPAFVGPIPASASFKLGYSYGWIVGLWQGRGFKVVLVTPQEWQKTMGVGTKKGGGHSTTEWKNVLKREAQRRFPSVEKITLKTADAFCLLSHAQQFNL
jgi:hypothetical protein